MRSGKPAERIIGTPPEVTVEVLSLKDRAATIQQRLDDYRAFCVLCLGDRPRLPPRVGSQERVLA